MNRKSLKKNALYSAIYSSLKILFPVITIPYVSRILLADGVGKVNYANNIVSWFLVFASLGIPRYGIREIAKYHNNKQDRDRVFTELFIINLISTIICIVLYVFLISSRPNFRSEIGLYVAVGIQLVLNILNTDWLFYGLEEYEYITQRSIAIKVASLAAIFCFIHTHDDYILYAAIQSLAIAGNNIFNGFRIRKYVRFRIDNSIQLKKHFRSIILLLSTTLATSVYSLLDTTMLGHFCSDEVVGYYSNVHKVILVIATITASIGSVILPRLTSYVYESNIDGFLQLSKKTISLIVSLCLPVSCGLFLISNDFVFAFFGENFSPSIQTMKIFSFFVIISTLGNLYGTQLLMALNEENKLLFCVIVGSLMNALMNYLLIPLYQQNGAAIASVITELIVTTAEVLFVWKHYRIYPERRDTITSIFSCCGMMIILFAIKNLLRNYSILRLSLCVICGIVSYFSLSIFLGNSSIKYCLTVCYSFLKRKR